MENPEDVLVKQGVLHPLPQFRGQTVTVAKIDMDVLFTALLTNLTRVFCCYGQLWRQFEDDPDEDDLDEGVDAYAIIKDCIYHYCHQAMNVLWNRLQAVAFSYLISIPESLERKKATDVYDFRFPVFFASLLSRIGPLYVTDSFSKNESIVIYLPDESLAYFGRAKDPNIDYWKVSRFQNALQMIKIPLGKIESNYHVLMPKGSYFTTCACVTSKCTSFSPFFDIFGAFRPSHYSDDDIIMAMLFGDFGADDNPFEDLSLSLGFVSDEATVKALLESVEPETRVNPTRPVRHVGGTYAINYLGLSPASDIPVSGRGQGMYVVGRGFDRHNVTCLARGFSDSDFFQILRHRIDHGTTFIL